MSLAVDRLRPARNEPTGAVILLHGRGADEHDLIPLLEVLDPDQQLMGVLPRAPLSLVEGGYAWYEAERVGEPDPSSLVAAVTAVDEWATSIEERTGVPRSRTVLLGFSQGGVIAYALGLGAGGDPFAAVLALSTYLPRLPDGALERPVVLRPPVTIAHGLLDPVIDVGYGRAARDILGDAGFDIAYRETPVEHTIDPAWLPLLRERVAAGLGAGP